MVVYTFPIPSPQGIPLTELPSDRDAARIAIGNGINRRMHEYVMTMTLLYTNQYLLVAEGKRDESTPTTTAVDEIEEEPATTQQMVQASEGSKKQYEELLAGCGFENSRTARLTAADTPRPTDEKANAGGGPRSGRPQGSGQHTNKIVQKPT